MAERWNSQRVHWCEVKRTQGTMSWCVFFTTSYSVNNVTCCIKRDMSENHCGHSLTFKLIKSILKKIRKKKKTYTILKIIQTWIKSGLVYVVQNKSQQIAQQWQRWQAWSKVWTEGVHASTMVEQGSRARVGQWGRWWWWEQTRATWGPWHCRSPPAVCPAVSLYTQIHTERCVRVCMC